MSLAASSVDLGNDPPLLRQRRQWDFDFTEIIKTKSTKQSTVPIKVDELIAACTLKKEPEKVCVNAFGRGENDVGRDYQSPSCVQKKDRETRH